MPNSIESTPVKRTPVKSAPKLNSSQLNSSKAGTFIGVGVGPGDPELITMKAFRLIQEADVISFIANEQGASQAKAIAVNALQGVAQKSELPVVMPMSEDRSVANARYDEAAQKIMCLLEEGTSVVFLCEGDPLFFGSFAYLLERIQTQYACLVVPGISSVHAASSVLQHPLTMLKESFAVVSGRHSQGELENTLSTHDSVVIMKAGRSREKILNALTAANRFDEAQYVEYIGRENEAIYKQLHDLPAGPGPYFSLFVITKKERDHR